MSDDASDKKHLPTAKRMDELRRQGNVLRSKDLTGALVFIVTIGMLIYSSDSYKNVLANNLIVSFKSISQVAFSSDLLTHYVNLIVSKSLMLILPLLIVIFFVTFLSPFLFGGWNFTLQAIQFKWDKFNPVTNLKNIYSFQRVMAEFFRSMLKSVLILGILLFFIWVNKNNIILIMTAGSNSFSMSYLLVMRFIFLLSGSLVFIVAFDIIYSQMQYLKKSKMSTHEVKDEHRQMEGSGETKRRQRKRQIALLRQRLTVTVPKSHVIITNPTHYAIALRYDEGRDQAPRVVAKGKDLIAEQIRVLAISNAIPIYEAPPLARAIYHTTLINHEIHPALYMAVAIVLSYVHQLKNYQQGIGQLPTFVSDLEIPKEFIYHE